MSLRIGLLLVVLPGMLRAQAPDTAHLSLARVVSTALERNPGLAMAEQRLAAGAGEVLSAEGAFGTYLSSTLGRAEETQRGLAADGAVSTQPTVVVGSYQMALTRQLRSGLLFQPTLSVGRTDVQTAGLAATNSASVGMQMVVPLWKDRGGALRRAPERAAAAGYTAAQHAVGHTAAASVLEAVAAYWDFAAARQRVQVYRESERRAARMADETRVLVDAAERPAADLNQLLANVASKRMVRIAAEQGVLEAQRRLGLAIGLEPAEIWALGSATDEFPGVRPLAVDSAAERRLVAAALARRADLAAAQGQERAAEVLLRAAHDDLKPRLDLSVSVGYTGLETGNGLNGLVAPLYRNVPGMNTSVQVEYRLPVRNADGQGRAMLRAAALEQERIRGRDLRRQIATGVSVALHALRSSALSAEAAESAVEMYRTNVDNESKKHQLDAATLLDVILAEDALTNAMLGQVSARLSYAVALVGLRFETGSLVSVANGRPAVQLSDLLRVPGEGTEP